MRPRLGRKLKAYINTLAKHFALRMKRSKADPQTAAHFAKLLYSYLEPGVVLPNGTRLTSRQFQALLRQTERHYNAMPYGRPPSSVKRIWSNPPKGSGKDVARFMQRRRVAGMKTDYPFYVVHPTLNEVWIHNEGDLRAYMKRARALNRMSRRRNPKRMTRADKAVKRIIAEIHADERHAVGGRYGKKFRGFVTVPGRFGHIAVFPHRRNPSENSILYENGDFWVTKHSFGKTNGYAVFKNEKSGHARRVASIGYEGQAGLTRAIAEADKRAAMKSNPLPASAPSRALLCIGQLRDLELYDPNTGRTGHLKPKGKWLAWDGKQFQICNVKGQVNAELPSNVVAKHRKFHASNPQGKPFLASMPDRGPTVKNVGLLKSLVYYVPSKIRSPGKNKYLWHHAFGDTGHKGGDSYPTKVMPMLQRDSAGNLFIKRRPGNIFRVDNWLRG